MNMQKIVSERRGGSIFSDRFLAFGSYLSALKTPGRM